MARLRGIFGKMADADSGSGEKESKAEVIVGKPIDIMIAVDKNKGVSFACEGHPVITFESLIQGKEIIIGNLQENGPMTKEALTKALVQLFGYSRSSRKLEEGAAVAIRAAKELKAIDIDEKKRYFLL